MSLCVVAILFYGSAFAVAIFFALCIILKATSKPYADVRRSKKERYFLDVASGKSIPFPSINDAKSINLSVIIPAYNEEIRLPPMLDECIEFLEEKYKPPITYEIIVVSDGSSDRTVDVAYEYSKKLTSEKLRVLALERNRGKGGAVRLGMQSARGSLLLFADADGATKFSDLRNVEDNLLKLVGNENLDEVAEKLAISVGSRAHIQDEAIATRSLFRTVLMYGFHFLVWLFAVKNIRDTQCGFKLFTRKAARICFESLHVERWAFDVELLYIAQTLRIPIAEVAVNWTEIDGSKITPIWSWIQMGKDLCLIWLRYRIGAWNIIKQKNM